MNITIFCLLAIAAFDYLSIGLVYPIFSSLFFSDASHGADLSYGDRGAILGLLLGIAPLVQFFVAPWVGRLSDRYGRRPLIFLTLGTGVCGYLIGGLSLVSGVWLPGLLFSRLLIGICSGNTAVVSAAIADVSNESTRPKLFSWLSCAYGLGFMIGPFFGGVLNNPPACLASFGPLLVGNDPSRPFFVAGVALLFGTLFFWFKLQETCLKAICPEKGPRDMAPNGVLASTRLPRHVPIFLLSTFVLLFGWSFYWEFISTSWVYLEKATVDEVGRRYAYGALWYVLLSLTFVQYCVRRASCSTLFLSGAGSLTVTVAAVVLLSDPVHLLWLVPLQQFGIGLIYPSALANISACAGVDGQGKIMGLHSAAVSLGFAVSPFSAGLFLSLSPNAPMYVGAISFGAAAMLFIAGSIAKKQEALLA